ncbi:hypothetical protein [Brevibacterium sp. CFH 10365]|uniref:hypothetical protein n=1 Tax=Brevibacterium sp. CFH 10365 TaxID=2585207 RepID=UPI00126632B8|nr:hypothetical protein [Brevibacterium sp. CFH 10365]
MDENFVPDRVQSFGGAYASLDGGSHVIGPLTETGTYYVRLVARSKAGKFSEPSAMAEQMLAIANVDEALTDAWITGTTAAITADGKNGIWRGSEAPEPDPDVPFKDGDIWFEMNEDGESIPNIFDESTGTWVSNRDARQSAIERVQEELRQDLDAVITDGSGTKNFFRPTAPTADEASEGDLWFDSSADGKNMPHVFQDGAWVSAADQRVGAIEQAQDGLVQDLADADERLDDAFGELSSIPGKISEAKNGAIDAAAADATAKANAAQQAAEAKAAAAQQKADIADDKVQALLAAGNSIIPNGDFENPSPHIWPNTTYQADVAVVEAPHARSGTRVMRMGTDTANRYPLTDWRDSAAGRVYYAEVWVYGNDEDPTYRGRVSFYAQSELADGSTTGYYGEDLDGKGAYFYQDSLVQGQWNKVSAYITTPVGTLRVRVAPHVLRNETPYDFDDFKVIDVTDSMAALREAKAAQAEAEAAHSAAGDAQNAAVAAMNAANGLSKVLHGTTGPSGTAPDGSVWFQHDSSLSGPVTGQWSRVSGAWKRTEISSEAIANLDVGKLTAGSAEIADLVAQKIFAEAVVAKTSTAEAFIGENAILSGAVTAAKMRAGTITAESGIIGSINAGAITVGEMDGARIKAQSIYSDKLLIGKQKSILPFSVSTIEPHRVLNGFTAGPTTDGDVGDCILLRGGGSAGTALQSAIYFRHSQSEEISPATPGGSYTFTVTMGVGGTLSGVGNARLVLRWYDSSGAYISGSAVSGDYFSPRSYTGVEAFSLTSKAPDNAYGFQALLQQQGGLSGGSYFLKDVRVEEQVGATLIEGGAITTEHIRAGAITAESGIVGSLNANVISVGKIMGNQLDADAINGKTITGATIRTASSGSRVELTHNGLKQYNSLGATIVDMTAGSFTLQGGSITGSTIKTANSGSRVEITTQGLKQYNASNEVIAEMIAGSMVMRGVLEQENSIAKMQVGPVWGDSATTSPGIYWDNIAGHSSGAALGVVTNGTDTVIALQGPSKVSGSNGSLLNLFDNRVYMRAREGGNYLDIKSGSAKLRGESSSTRYVYLDMDSAAGKGAHINRSTSTNGGSWLSMYDDQNIFTWSHPTNSGSAYLRLEDRTINLRAYDSNSSLVGGLWMDPTETILSGFKRQTEIWGGDGARMLWTKTSNGPRIQSSTIYNVTSTSGSVMRINGEGTLYREASSLRYKTDVEDAPLLSSVLDVQPRTWIDKADVASAQTLSEFREEVPIGPAPREVGGATSEPARHFGAIAEEVDELGLTHLVEYDAFGRPDSLHYERFGVALIPIVRELRDRIEELEAQVAA